MAVINHQSKISIINYAVNLERTVNLTWAKARTGQGVTIEFPLDTKQKKNYDQIMSLFFFRFGGTR